VLAKKISLVLADVDGTLVTNEKVLTGRACDAVAVLRRAGIRFAIGGSGRYRALSQETHAKEVLRHSSVRSQSQIHSSGRGRNSSLPRALAFKAPLSLVA
jgi:ribonucleotide monophosphatase NagD (HAD superfamily)